MLKMTPLYFALMFTRVLPSLDGVHEKFEKCLKTDTKKEYVLLNLEWSFRSLLTQELFMFSGPQLVIMAVNNN